MFEKKNSTLSNTTDTDKTHKGNGNDTATPESTVISVSKDRQSFDTLQGEVDKVSESNAVGGDLFATAERVTTEYRCWRGYSPIKVCKFHFSFFIVYKYKDKKKEAYTLL
mgnify:CR=1 FL=1